MKPEPLIFELSKQGRRGVELPVSDVPETDISQYLSAESLRTSLEMPELSEPTVIRHFTRLSQRNYSIDAGFYPLGSCTMKYNPRMHEDVARLPGFARLHPNTPEHLAQGALQVIFEMQNILAEIAGMDACTLQPAAGAHGELLGLMLIKAWHKSNGTDTSKTKILVPEAAHGTNPASAARCGYKTVSIRSDERGRVDMDHLRTLVDDQVAGLMLTNPNTLGLFEGSIADISRLVHGVGGLMYCDGANMNALIGRARPGDMGFDVMHFNLHKTFSTPHGGGGPGSGPVAVKKMLEPFLPVPAVTKADDGTYLFDNDRPHSIGKIHSFYGSFMAYLRAYVYVLYYGREHIKEIAENAVLNANYIKSSLQSELPVAFDEICMHECVFSAKTLAREHGVKAYDIAKRMMDYGYHPPTIYFPLIAPEALMVEPTETESKETLDEFIEAMKAIMNEARTDSALLKNAPFTTPVRRLDEATAARNPDLRWVCGPTCDTA